VVKRVPKFSIAILSFLLLFSLFGSFVYTVSPFDLNKDAILLPPSLTNPLGTDILGRDILARVIDGAYVSIIIAILSGLISSLIGVIIGMSSAFFRGLVDKTVVVIIDLFLTFPTFFLLLALVSFIDASIFILIFVISITSWMSSARMIRSEAFSISQKPYIKILKIANVKTIKILFKYILPQLFPIFLVGFSFGVGGAILAESSLSFLGLGINPPSMSLGLLLSEGKEILDIAWWVSFFPGLYIFLLTFSLINISDYLQNLANSKV